MKFLTLNRSLPTIALGSVGVITLLILMRSLVVIPTGQIAVVDLYGNVADQPLTPGIHFKNPFAQLIKFSSQTREVKETLQTPSKEGLMLTIDVSILYRLDPAKAKHLYQSVGTNYEEVLLKPQVRSLVRGATANYEARTVYTSDRQSFAQQLRDQLNQILSDRGIVVEDTPLRNVKLPESIEQAVQEKLKAEQDSQRMKFVLDRERQEAERKRIEAQGNADAQRILSQGLSDRALQFKQIEATQKLAESQNTKVIILGNDAKTPMMIQP